MSGFTGTNGLCLQKRIRHWDALHLTHCNGVIILKRFDLVTKE